MLDIVFEILLEIGSADASRQSAGLWARELWSLQAIYGMALAARRGAITAWCRFEGFYFIHAEGRRRGWGIRRAWFTLYRLSVYTMSLLGSSIGEK